MADLSQTAANVGIGVAGCPTKIVQYGEAITQGQPLYLSNGKYYKCDANVALANAACVGIALTPGATDGFGVMAVPSNRSGVSLVNLGATLAIGTQYAVSATAGAIAPLADISSTQFPTSIGFAVSTSLLDFQVTSSSVAKA